MKWKKLGFLLTPNPHLWWLQSHGMIPTPDRIDSDLYKIYFSGRDEKNRSHIGWVLVNLNDPIKVLEMSADPVLVPGNLGCFDDNGVTPSCIINAGDDKYLYYIGWNPGSTTRMHIFGGLAISRDAGKTFQRYSRAPIIERNRVNPFINTAPFILRESERDWKMYYVAGVEWRHKDLPRYNIQLATSLDGLEWKREGHVCIDFGKDENALARPFVLKEDGIYKMWFAAKGSAYRICYAESKDGFQWTRKDENVGITTSPAGPDSEMIEYACVIPHRGRKVMYYNGNDYGRGGILTAVEEK